MVVDKSIVGQFVQDGNKTIESVTVPDGEIWRVDAIYVDCEGDGAGDTSILVKLAVGQPAAIDAGRYSSRDGTADVNPTEAGDYAIGNVGAYAVGGEEIRALSDSDGGGGGTVYYSILLRRVV
jgi:hypothetical protein